MNYSNIINYSNMMNYSNNSNMMDCSNTIDYSNYSNIINYSNYSSNKYLENFIRIFAEYEYYSNDEYRSEALDVPQFKGRGYVDHFSYDFHGTRENHMLQKIRP